MALGAAVLALAACASTAPVGGPNHPSRGTGGAHASPQGSGRGFDVRRAALPFRVLRGHGGAEVSEADFFAELDAADAVCLGEEHPNPHHHWVQLMVIEHLAKAAAGKRSLGIGFEMFSRPFQGVLDDFAAGRIDEPALLARTGWEERWGYDFGLYRPMLELGVTGHHALLALNVPRELAHKVKEVGLGKLSEGEKQSLPELELHDDAHRAWFKDATSNHADVGGEGFENFYAAQVVWDETMADTAARWLAAGGAGAPRRQVAIVAGVGHCFDAAVPKRLRRRGVGKALSLQAVIDDGGGAAVADILARPENDYVIVLDASGH